MFQRLFSHHIALAMVAGLGAMVCITALSGLTRLDGSMIGLMAPFGATMVILFGLPESPLAQPRNILLGHLLTSAIGLGVVTLLGVSPWTLGLAVGLAVAAMLVTNTTHPPAGANPLLVMLTGESWDFLLAPVTLGALLILVFGFVYHRLISGVSYPKRWY